MPVLQTWTASVKRAENARLETVKVAARACAAAGAGEVCFAEEAHFEGPAPATVNGEKATARAVEHARAVLIGRHP